MGCWTMVISGVGPHHNTDHAGDADRIFNETVGALKDNGHKVEVAVLTVGSHEGPKKEVPF